MITRWLLTTLPAELTAAWRVVRVDIGLWLLLALVPAIVTSAGVRTDAASGAALSALSLLSIVLPLMLAVVKFDAARRGATIPAAQAASRIVHRVVPFTATLLAVLTITLGAGWLAERAVLLVARGTPMASSVAAVVSTVVYLSLLVRYSFWTYLVVLDRLADLALGSVAPRRWLRPLARIGWPLMASTAMTQGFRWRLAPYVVLMGLGPALTARAAPALHPPLMAAWWMVQLTLQAVLFNHYAERRTLIDAPAPDRS